MPIQFKVYLTCIICVLGLTACQDQSSSRGEIIDLSGASAIGDGQSSSMMGTDLGTDTVGGAEVSIDVGGALGDGSNMGGVEAVDVLRPQTPSDICDELNLPRKEMQSGTGFDFGDIAEPFIVNTLDQNWSLAEAWTGCESYVFLTYFPDLRANPDGPWLGDALWASQIKDLFLVGPRNVHYFFVSYEATLNERNTRMNEQKNRLEQVLLSRLSDETDRAFWRSRVHFVTDRVTDIQGGIGGFFNDYMAYLFEPSSLADLGNRGMAQPPLPFAFGIDRSQHWDSVGSLSPVVGQPDQWAMAFYAPHFYNHKAALAARLAGEEATVIPLIDDAVTDRHIVRTVILPDASAMADFNTLEIDINVTCPHRNVFNCSEWDRIGRIQFCLDPECMEQREVARWITPYWRRGHRQWTIDASPFLHLMTEGGEQTFKLVMGPQFERATARHAKFALRLRNTNQLRSAGVERVYTGGGFNDQYNMNHGPVEFVVPSEATKAELVLILSGHGQADNTNCSEWCDHRHEFSVNGTPLPVVRSNIVIGGLRSCADKSSEGVPPGQFGNWAPGRAFWCPGWPVDAIRLDITEQLAAQETHQLAYSANLNGGTPGGGNIDLSAYVVWYTD